MASWLASQLKVAEGLLEAVDKTVSKTVGTLGALGEGDSELSADVTNDGTYMASRAAQSNLPQGGPPTSTPSTLAPSRPPPPDYSTYRYTGAAAASTTPNYLTHNPASSTSSTSYSMPGSSASSKVPYSTAPSAAPAPPTSTGGGAAGGFMVRADGPIPFGSRPAGPPPPAMVAGYVHTSLSRHGSQSAMSAGSGGAPGDSVRSSADGGGLAGVPGLAAPGAGAQQPRQALGSGSWPSDGGSAPSGMEAHIGAAQRQGSGAYVPPPTASAPAPIAPISSSGLSTPGPGPVAAHRQHSRTASVDAGAAAAATPPAKRTSGDAPAPAPGSDTASPPTAPVASSLATAAAPSPAAAAVTNAAATLASATSSFLNMVLDDAGGAAANASAASVAAAAGGTNPADGSGQLQQQVQQLSRNCEQLKKRLEASRLENEQLEDMLARAEVRVQQEAALAASLKEQLAAATQARGSTESSLSAQLSVAKASLAEVGAKYEAASRQVLVLEGQLAALEESSRRQMEQQSDREGGVVEALRAELSTAESRLAAERKAHAATRAAAAQRELDLEQQLAGGSGALADLQRQLEEAARKTRDAEDAAVAAARSRNELSAAVAALRAQLEAAGIQPAEGPGAVAGAGAAAAARGAAAAAAAAELEALRGEVLQHRRAAAASQQAAEASAAQVAAMAAELEALRESAQNRKDTSALEAQVREMSDMLYLKQTQLERLAAEKAAQQLKTERELEAARQELAKVTRQLLQTPGSSALPPSSHASSLGHGHGHGSHDVIPMDALGEPYQRLTRHTGVGKAVKAAANLLDSTASTVSFLLRQYPLGRLCVFAYVLLIHLYVYFLLARMQRLATHWEAQVAAAPPVP